MITGTFYGNSVRIDTHSTHAGTTYHVLTREDNAWITRAIFSDEADARARESAIKLAKRLKSEAVKR